VRLTTSPHSCAECHEVWETKSPGTLWTTPALLRDSFTCISFNSAIEVSPHCQRGLQYLHIEHEILARWRLYRAVTRSWQAGLFIFCNSGIHLPLTACCAILVWIPSRGGNIRERTSFQMRVFILSVFLEQ
jgi:hypothetical protein